MRVLVTGGTGHLGRALVPQLQQRGHQLRVLARAPGTLRGVEWAIAQRGRFRFGDFFHSPTSVDVEGTRLLVDRAGLTSHPPMPARYR